MITNLQRREIQAPTIVALIKAFAKEFGFEKAIEIATDAIQGEARLAGRLIAEKYGGNSLQVLIQVLREVWAEDGALEYRVLEQTPKKLSFDVTCCRYAELYERLSIKEFGVCLSCNRDEIYTRGFNPNIKLIRTQTIMEGANFCDFRFTMEP